MATRGRGVWLQILFLSHKEQLSDSNSKHFSGLQPQSFISGHIKSKNLSIL